MSKTLVIVESPAKAKTIQKYLGDDFIVKASFGHVRDLPTDELGVDIENNFKPVYKIYKEKVKLIKELQEIASKVDRVILASDPDREGEAIAWHLDAVLKSKCSNISRAEFHEITKKEILKCINESHPVNLDLVNSQQARRILDRIVGYQLSPWVSSSLGGKLSAGRVQSAWLRMICDRDREIKNFIPEEYWKIIATLNPMDKEFPFDAELIKKGIDKIDIKNKEQADAILRDLSDAVYKIKDITREDRKKSPAAPFTTSTLQQEGVKKLKWDSKKVMQIAQQLYEGVETGNGLHGLITYMRTDSTRISEDFQNDTIQYIKDKWGNQYAPVKPNVYKVKGEAQDAHEAVRPTAFNRDPESIKQYVTLDQYQLYKLIWDRYMASQMASAIYDTLSVQIEAKEYTFKTTGSTLRFNGFMVLYQEDEDEENKDSGEEKEINLPVLNLGEFLRLNKLTPNQKFTKPPAYFTEATLIKEAERLGIGRPSTYANTISTIKDRGYVVIKSNKFYPTDLGNKVVDLLIDYFGDIINVKFTAEMENELDDVAIRKNQWVNVLHSFYTPFSETLIKAKAEVKPVVKHLELSGDDCPDCGKPMAIRTTTKGKFIACTGFPECKKILPFIDESMKSGIACDLCGKDMIKKEYVKDKKKVKYLGCIDYPNCKNMILLDSKGKPIEKPKESDVDCPVCGKKMLIRSNSKGKFLACSGYPDCSKILPYIDENQKTRTCEKCNNIMIIRKGQYGFFWSCTGYPDCKHIVSCDKNGVIEEKKTVETSDVICPDCKKPMVIRSGSKGKFLACSGYPDCKKIMVYIDPSQATKPCDKCGKSMTIRNGKNGYFWSCSGYPSCHNVISCDKNGNEIKEETTDKKCPNCGKEMVVRNGKSGKYYACSGYPTCKTTFPYGDTKPCSKCGKPMVKRKGTKGDFWGCTGYPNCNNIENI